MKKVTLVHEFEFSIEKLVEGRAARYDHKDWWPEIISSEIELEEKTEEYHKVVRRVFLENKLSAGKIFKDHHYTAIEETVYKFKEKKLYLQSALDSHKALLQFEESSVYSEHSPGDNQRSKREITLTVDVKIPLVGGAVESAITKEFSAISEKDRDKINDYINSIY